MKKASRSIKERNRRLKRKRTKSSLKKRRRKQEARRKHAQQQQDAAAWDMPYSIVNYHGAPGQKEKRFTFIAPPHLSLVGNNRARVLEFLWFLEERTLKEVYPVFIDFSKVIQCEAAGTMVTLATIDRIKTRSELENPIVASEPVDEVVRQVFCQVGLAEILGFNFDMQISHEDVTYWRCVNGTKLDVSDARRTLISIFREYSFDETAVKALSMGLDEAITNVSMHAYPNDSGDWPAKFKKIIKEEQAYWDESSAKWWMFAGVKDNELCVVVYDAGIGIPKSIRHAKKNLVAWILDVIKHQTTNMDPTLIKIAMQSRKSRFQKDWHGRGMDDLKDFININQKGSLVVLSLKGGYFYPEKYVGNEGEISFQDSLRGTMVIWKTPLSTTSEEFSQDGVLHE